jgi:hypothetical protein
MATAAEIAQTWECAETQEGLNCQSTRNHSNDSAEDNGSTRKPDEKPKTTSRSDKNRSECCCKEHVPSDTHPTNECKVLVARNKKDNWEKKDNSESKCSHCESKCKKKPAKLNLLGFSP